MQLVIQFPDISPEIVSFTIGGFAFALRWYAMAYVAGLLLGLFLLRRLVRIDRIWPGGKAPLSLDQAEALLSWVILGVILGGRIGYVLFYQPEFYLAHPADIIKVWQGGMSFHGGLIGVTIASLIFCYRHRLMPLGVADALALCTPSGLFFGRIANFINGELWGRPSHVPWAVVYPNPEAQMCPAGWVGVCARHPSELYEAGLEGIVLGLVLWTLALKTDWLMARGRMCGTFIAGYGLARFTVEFFRQADPQFITPDNPWGHVIRFGQYGLTQGQTLSLPMVVLGLAMMVWAGRRTRTA